MRYFIIIFGVIMALAIALTGCQAQNTSSADEIAAAPESQLSLEIFVSEPNEVNVTSALIMGPTEMMVVSAQGTKSAAIDLADVIEGKGKSLKYIFLTHPHLDHAQGASVLKQRFPEARFIATPITAFMQRNRIPTSDALAVARYGDNAAVPSVPAEDYHGSKLFIDGEEVEIWSGLIGDVGSGPISEPHSAIFVPGLNAFMPSDIVYFNGHVMMGGSTPESRAQWLAQIDHWISLEFDTVVPGHMPKTSLGDLTAQGALEHSAAYIRSYDEVMATSETSEQVIERMIELYPDAQHQSALYLGTYLNFAERDKAMAYIVQWSQK